MPSKARLLFVLTLLVGGLLIVAIPRPAQAYVEIPYALGKIIAESTNIVVMRVEKVDKEKNLIVYRKVRDLKGKHPTEEIKHNIGRAGFNPREWQYPMAWAEVGKTAVFFHNGGASETCIGTYWYQAYAGDWWGMSHGEPFMLRSFAGNIDKLIAAVTIIVAGGESVVPCMVDGPKDDLHLRRAKIQRLRVSLKLQEYNPKRDFVGWGGEDFVRINSMPGFTHMSGLARVDPEAQAISSLDIDGDGKPDLCLVGASKIALLQNGGEALTELSLPGGSGCRAAVWADYNGDGLPDLLLATASGPKLYTNLGKGNFRDDSHLLPREPGYNLTSAAWIDQDGDGRPDILLGNGYHGLRLYRNKGAVDAGKEPIALGSWHYIGPFSNSGAKGFATVYPPEKEINLQAKYPGKAGQPIGWQEGKFNDGEINNLAIFEPQHNVDSVVYLYREIDCAAAMDVPASFGSDDTLTVWLNGKQLLAHNEYRACAPDQHRLVLNLKAGKNKLLLKVCQGQGEWAYYFKAEAGLPPRVTWAFADVSDEVGLGRHGIGSTVKGDSLTVCDVNGDGRPDFLYGAGTGLLVLNTPKGFVEAKDHGIVYQTGKVGPVFGDFDNSGAPSLLVPQVGGCKLFKNDGKGHFSDVTAQAGLDKFKGHAACAAWGDVDNDGHLDLVIGCLHGSNRYFHNKGDGTFEDQSEALGLDQKVFNTQAVCLVDINGDGVLDMVFNNEGQESCVLLGNPEKVAKRTPVTVNVAGKEGVTGSRVMVMDMGGKVLASHQVSGGDGRGGQAAPTARFNLEPGAYRVEVQYSNGVRRAKDITVSQTAFRGIVDDETPKME